MLEDALGMLGRYVETGDEQALDGAKTQIAQFRQRVDVVS
jgi:hypothetical protein